MLTLPTHREVPMKMIVASMLALALTASVAQAGTCSADAKDKKLAGAALKSFMTKCERDAKTTCSTNAKDKKLAGAAATSFTNKCVKDSVGS
jgi:hypothetical protein